MKISIDMIYVRRSIRKFRPDPVPEDSIRRLLEAANAAPSAHNTQPWRFVVLRDAGARRLLAEGMAAVYARDAETDGMDPEKIRGRNDRSVARIAGAPLAILACMDEACIPANSGRSTEGERLLLTQSVAAAVENLLLAATEEKLGACWLCAPAFCPSAVAETLALPKNWIAQALILIGLPAETPAKPNRHTPGEVVQWR